MLFISVKHEPDFKLLLSYKEVICPLVFKVKWQISGETYQQQNEEYTELKLPISVTFSRENSQQ